ncbi:MAG: hypothetical protein GKR89_29350 [Candidatus Latescibacteria bacterium]|nr:hypothetical protein [Candidatus Latescibacterota bacterium]
MQLIKRLGVALHDSDAVRLQKNLLVISSGMMGSLALLWGSIYWGLGEHLAAAIPLGYTVLTLLSIGTFAWTRRYRLFRTSQLFFLLLLPFLLMLALGGFTNSSGVVLWSLTAPLGALLFAGRRHALVWFIVYLALVLIGIFLQPFLRPENLLSTGWKLVFSGLNISGTSVVAFVSLHYFVGQKDAMLNTLQETLRQLQQTQEQLVVQEKMASLSSLAAGLAHEINTPIGALDSMRNTLGRAVEKLRQALATDFPDAYQNNRTVQGLLQVMANADQVMAAGTQRVQDLVQNLQNFIRLDQAEFQPVDLHEGLDSTLALLSRELGQDIRIVRDYGSVPPLYCAPGRLNQVFMRLFENAIRSVGSKGEIRIQTSQQETQACIQISDTGKGIPSEQIERIFDLSFATTGDRVEVDWGLSAAYAIVQGHGGTIDVSSAAGKNTIVSVVLPVR